MALFSATFGTLASLATLAAGAATVGVTAASAAGAFTPKPKETELPQLPKIESAEETLRKSQEQAQKGIRARQIAAGRSQSIFTSPLGLAGEASTVRHTLLGQ